MTQKIRGDEFNLASKIIVLKCEFVTTRAVPKNNVQATLLNDLLLSPIIMEVFTIVKIQFTNPTL